MTRPGHIAIIGSGPTGLGAAWRLKELGHDDFMIYEAADIVGGLAASHVDPHGFTWDIGGHVQFSHYGYFDRVMDEVLPAEEWLRHERESWIWMKDRFIPYPFQYNLHRLPEGDMARCLQGMVDAQAASPAAPANFREWILSTFGEGVAELFMFPYNEKVWAHPTEALSSGWIGERVAAPDLDRVRRTIASQKDDKSWGPNNTFRFPRHGGTGAIWEAVAERIGFEKIALRAPVRAVHADKKLLTFADGSERPYDLLLSTAPLDRLAAMVTGLPEIARTRAAELKRSAVNIVGVGLQGRPSAQLADKCWIYFPEANCPFHRATVFSNYSPNNVPDITAHWSLMTEVSESAVKPVDHGTLVDDVVRGCRATGLIGPDDTIVSTWHYRAEYGYPTPSVERDEILSLVQPMLERTDIYSRGRFGAWKYEASNQDHSFMQGVEWVDRMLHGAMEATYATPHVINAGTARAAK